MLKRLESNPSSIIDKIFKGNLVSWQTETKDLLNDFEINPEVSLSKKALKDKVKSKFDTNITKPFQEKSKLKYLQKTENNYQVCRKNYSLIFKVRTRMFPVKCNYKTSYQDLSCRLCGAQEETQDHVLFDCPQAGGIDKEHLLQDENMTKLRESTQKLEQIINQLNSAPLKVGVKS